MGRWPALWRTLWHEGERAYKREALRRRRIRRKRAGLCVQCRAPAKPFVRCAPCRAYNLRQYYARREQALQDKRERWALLKRVGLCPCKKRDPAPGRTRCATCLAYNRRYFRRVRRKERA